MLKIVITILVILFVSNDCYPQPKYSCSHINISVDRAVFLFFIPKQFFNAKLEIFVSYGSNGTSKTLDSFTRHLIQFEKAHPIIFSSIKDVIGSSRGITKIWLFSHPDVFLGGETFNDIENKDKYFLSVKDLTKFPDCNQLTEKRRKALKNWVTTKCMVLAHELIESVKGKSHSDGIDFENKLRVDIGVQDFKTGQGKLRHKDHCDIIIPIGDNLERFHLMSNSNRLKKINYH